MEDTADTADMAMAMVATVMVTAMVDTDPMAAEDTGKNNYSKLQWNGEIIILFYYYSFLAVDTVMAVTTATAVDMDTTTDRDRPCFNLYLRNTTQKIDWGSYSQ